MHTSRTAAFAHERAAAHALQLLRSIDDVVCTVRHVLDERGDVQQVMIEVTVADADQAIRAETLLIGAHGVIVPPAVLVVDVGVGRQLAEAS